MQAPEGDAIARLINKAKTSTPGVSAAASVKSVTADPIAAALARAKAIAAKIAAKATGAPVPSEEPPAAAATAATTSTNHKHQKLV